MWRVVKISFMEDVSINKTYGFLLTLSGERECPLITNFSYILEEGWEGEKV